MPRYKPTGVTLAVSSNQATLWHTEGPAYRCFLPDLAGFTGFCCIGPDYQHHLPGAVPTGRYLSKEFDPAIADCRYRAPLPPRLARPWRRERDSNPRNPFGGFTRFPVVLLRPLGHLSTLQL